MPSSLPLGSLQAFATTPSLALRSQSSQTSLELNTNTSPTCSPQSKQLNALRYQRTGTTTSRSRRPQLPPASSHWPVSPCSPRFPYSPTTPTSPLNPFLYPPPPCLTSSPLFRLASPLLPASPLSIFDRAISPTSPTFLQSTTPSPRLPSWEVTFGRAPTQDVESREEWDGLSPTFLWPRTPPSVPLRHPTGVRALGVAVERDGSVGQDKMSLAVSVVVGSIGVEAADAVRVERKKMKIDFYHLLATKRAAAVDATGRFSVAPSILPSKKQSAKEKWKKLIPRNRVKEIRPWPSKRSRFSVWSGLWL